MKYCAACGTALDDAAAFCSGCGAQQAPVAPVAPVEAAPVEVAPVEAPVVETAPAPVATVAYPAYPPTVMPVQEEPSVGAKVMSGIGLGLAIFGFVFAFFAFIIGAIAAGDYDEDAAVTAIMFAVMFLPTSILGTCFCGSGRKNGVGGPAITGKIFGIIGCVLYGIGFLCSLAALS